MLKIYSSIKMKISFFVVTLMISLITFAQNNAFDATNIEINRYISGTLLTPNKESDSTGNLAILIADSGPTDRNGNQSFLKNNSLKKLSEALSNQGIVTFRYDKRTVKQIRQGYVDKNILFNDFVTDAISVVEYFKTKNAYDKIFVIGHSQGSLVGMLAAKENVDGFISIAGAGQSIDNVIMEQIATTAPMFTEDAKKTFNILKQGQVTDDYPPALASFFSKDIQPFMANWMQYNPQEEIKQLQIPTLIINGTKDLQVTVKEATLLKEASPNATLKIINNMNHIMFSIEGDSLENSKSYNESFRELNPELIESLIDFIK